MADRSAALACVALERTQTRARYVLCRTRVSRRGGEEKKLEYKLATDVKKMISVIFKTWSASKFEEVNHTDRPKINGVAQPRIYFWKLAAERGHIFDDLVRMWKPEEKLTKKDMGFRLPSPRAQDPRVGPVQLDISED